MEDTHICPVCKATFKTDLMLLLHAHDCITPFGKECIEHISLADVETCIKKSSIAADAVIEKIWFSPRAPPNNRNIRYADRDTVYVYSGKYWTKARLKQTVDAMISYATSIIQKHPAFQAINDCDCSASYKLLCFDDNTRSIVHERVKERLYDRSKLEGKFKPKYY
jgi:hypothetical protein